MRIEVSLHGVAVDGRVISYRPFQDSTKGHEPADEEDIMGIGDKINNKAEELGGKAKEAAGQASGDERLEAEGQKDQASAGLKQAGEKVKDAAAEAVDNVKDIFKK
ncbi:uncharacterized protein YjbJ (UPF0337 family) [Arthrobacter woluwensis]|nr:uncharacterized protein YjbJ (UPF0337 family) [Arthrobacter woluwensis]